MAKTNSKDQDRTERSRTRESAEELAGAVKEDIHGMVERGRESFESLKKKAKNQMGRIEEDIRMHPIRDAAIAAAIGAFIGVLLASGMHHRRNQWDQRGYRDYRKY